MREQKTKAQVKKTCEIIPTSCPSTHTLTWINHPHLSHSPIIHNKNTINTGFLVQMRQSNKCWSVRNDEIFNLGLQSGAGPWVSVPCLLQNTSHIYLFHLPKQLTRGKQRTEINSQSEMVMNSVDLKISIKRLPEAKRKYVFAWNLDASKSEKTIV